MNSWKEFAKGFRTFIVGILGIAVGGLMGAGFLTPELGAEVTADVLEVVDYIEKLTGAIMAAGGTLGIALRFITNTPIFKKQ